MCMQLNIRTTRKKIALAAISCLMMFPAALVSAQHVVRAACSKENPAEVRVKWFVEELYNKEGFNVYRKEPGAGDWIKVSKSPVLKQEGIDPQALNADKELPSFVEAINQSFPRPIPEMMKLFILLKTMQSEPFARFMGITMRDGSAQAQKNYTYKVTRLKNGKEEEVGISNEVTGGTYKPEPPPQAFKIEVKKKNTEMTWQLEPERLYAFNVYRGVTSSANAMSKLNQRPILIFDSPDETGNMVKPGSYYTDENVQEGKTYYYRLTGLDVFGSESESSPVMQTAFADSTPPPPVDALKAKGNDKVLLNWIAPQAEDLKGYNIYISSKAEGPFKKLNEQTVTSASFEHAPGKKGVYFYKVTAVDLSANESAGQIAVAEIEDTEPPLPPANLKAVADTGEVRVSWDATPSADFWAYYVLRAANEDKPSNYVRVNSEPLRVTNFIDKMPKEADNKTFYRVIAMDSSALESAPSETVEARIPDVTSPPPPFIKIVETELGKNTIHWMPSLCNDLAGYNIYRAPSEDTSKFTLLNAALLDKTVKSFEDAKVEEGKSYYYKILAVDGAGNISASSNLYSAVSKQNVQSAAPPQNVAAGYNDRKKEVTVKWKITTSEGLKGVMVYRSEEGGRLYPVSSLLSAAEFSDNKISLNKTYAYQVRSLYENGATGRSEPVQLTIK